MLDKIETFAEKHGLFPEDGLILAAVSGGADSVCLLEVLLELSGKRGFTVEAMHYNHRLRGEESDRDALFVKELCQKKNIAFHCASGDVSAFARDNGYGIEEAARRLRYGFFYETADKLKAKRIATAHTADDNTETVLFNLTRGAGLRGIGGIPPSRGIVIRPMLEVSRAEVIEFLAGRSQPYMEDSTNAMLICSRNMIRHRVVPVLKELNPRLTESISTASELVREDEAYLSGLAEQFIEGFVQTDQTVGSGESSLDAGALTRLPRPVARRVVRKLAGRASTAKHVSAVLSLCASEDVSGKVSLPGCTVYREYARVVFSPRETDAADGFEPVGLAIGGSADIRELGLRVSCRKAAFSSSGVSTEINEKIKKSFNTFLFNYDNIYGKIVIRSRKTGDKINLFGRNGTKTLKKLFIENRIPVRKRPLIPVVADDIGVLGVYGLGFDKRTVCRAGDAVLEIIFEETAYET